MAILDLRSSILNDHAQGRKSMKRSATFVLSLTIYWLSAAAVSEAQTASQPALVEGAKKEGKLVWYTSMAIDTSKPLLDAFLKDYPFIQAELVRLGEEQLMTRILSEVRGGKWAFDIMSGSAISTFSGPTHYRALFNAQQGRVPR
jgi:iron(III) transport system substrate-binding protein